LCRDRLFYFLSYQDLIDRGAVTAQAQTQTPHQRGLTSSGTAIPCQTTAYGSQQCATFEEDFLPVTSSTPNAQIWTNPVKGPYASYAISGLNTAYTVATGIPTDTVNSPCVALLLAQPSYTSSSISQYPTLQYPEIPQICWNPITTRLLAQMPFPNNYLPTAPGYEPTFVAVSVQKQPRNDNADSA
jgi:hypothetical protein